MWSEEGMLACGQRACDIGRGAPKMGMGAPSARVILKHRDGETIFRAYSGYPISCLRLRPTVP